MAETIPGGATKNSAGEWQNADGEPLSKEQVTAAEKLAKEQAKQEEQQSAPAQPVVAVAPVAAVPSKAGS